MTTLTAHGSDESARSLSHGRGALSDSRAIEARVPASTANLGSGFDCCGIALQLYLTIRASVVAESGEACRVRTRGEGSGARLPRATDNLIYRAMRFVADREGLTLPAVRLAVCNDIPLASGLGSSGAAIVAGAMLCAPLCSTTIPHENLLRHVTAFEGHADNVAASLLGGWVVNCIKSDGEVFAVRRRWSPEIKFVVVTPHLGLATERARAALPAVVPLADAVHNLQRASLFAAAMETSRHDLLWEAMRDRLHQPHRQPLVPGLAAALAIQPMPGLLGVALSGAGPSVLALARDNFAAIGARIASNFQDRNIGTTVRVLDADADGARITRASDDIKD